MEHIDCVDAHFHMWDMKKFSYAWPTEKETILFRNYLAEDFEKAMQETPVRHAVFVQVLNNSPEEALWVSELAEKHNVIKGVVAGIDVTDKNLEQTLDRLSTKKKIVGVRHILDMEEQDWLSRDDVIAGLRVLESRNIPFDLLLRPPLIKHVPRLSEQLPRLRMVVDHLAKPYIKNGLIDEWAKDMETVAANSNIYCKLSGMVTEADLNHWKMEQFEPYVKHILQCFGPSRCMFGSDWPVCQMAWASYSDVFCVMQQLIQKLSPGNERAIFRDNAAEFYGLKL